jgi:hypothetical protein
VKTETDEPVYGRFAQANMENCGIAYISAVQQLPKHIKQYYCTDIAFDDKRFIRLKVARQCTV